MIDPLVINRQPAAGRLAFVIDHVARSEPSRPAVVGSAGSPSRTVVSYASLADLVARCAAALAEAKPPGVVVRATTPEAIIAAAAASGREGVSVALLSEDALDLVGELRDWAVVNDSLDVLTPTRQRAVGGHDEPPHVVVATSGTAGPPKLVYRTWDAVLAAARLSEQWFGLRWLLAYDATRWAGIQVWSQSLLTAGCLVAPASRDPDTVARALGEEHVSILPSTPTLLRRLVSFADHGLLKAAAVERITLGGEVADGPLLRQAKAAFPNARLSHVYATTELGEVFRVSDGEPGFPAAWMNRELPGGVRLSTRRDGELIVQLSRDSADVPTGDIVEQRGERYEFTGRRSDVIVVGGAKVFPRRVEETMRGVMGVAEARVFGYPSAITGELVAAEIVLTDPLPEGATPESVRAAAFGACRDALEPHSVPRILDIVRQIAVTTAGKTPRRKAPV